MLAISDFSNELAAMVERAAAGVVAVHGGRCETASGVAWNEHQIVTAAMDLFGRQGYHATTVAQIEAAAGLSAGAGGLYRHFKSKRALLEEAVRRGFIACRLFPTRSSPLPSGNVMDEIEPNPRGITRSEVEQAVAEWCQTHTDAPLCKKLERP